MLTINQGSTVYRIHPENEAKWRVAIAKAAKRYRRPRMYPDTPRIYPRFVAGMTAGEYIAAYSKPPGIRYGDIRVLVDKTWPGWDRPAPMLDWAVPECVEG